MDRRAITNLLSEQLVSLNPVDVRVSLYPHEILKLVVVSRVFKSMTITKRITAVSEMLLPVTTTDLSEYGLIIEPLTPEEFDSNSRDIEEMGILENTNVAKIA